MSIQVKCPKGHVLKVKNEMAGKTGLCPLCKGQVYVYVPDPNEKKVSEDVILDYLGSSQPSASDTSTSGINLQETKLHRPEKTRAETPWKCCVNCNRDIPSKSHICPYCHTYIADLGDFK